MDVWTTISEGDKVKIKVDDGEFQGIVHSIDLDNRVIGFSKVVSLPSSKSFKTILWFYGQEIETVEVLEKNDTKERHTNPRLEVKRTIPPNDNIVVKKDANLPEKKYVKCDVTGLQESSFSEDSDGGYGEASIKVGARQVPSCIISKINTEFYDAVKYIKSQAIIGLNVEGIDIGRFGKLCWLQIATRDQVFLFDMLFLGRDFFEEGLKTILESPSILKVVHDCRQISDMFHHQYVLSLVNVFDTQVADILVHKLNSNTLPKNVKSLSTCLVEHLKLTQNAIYFPHAVSAECRRMDLAVWKQRPLPPELRDAAVKDVVHLRDLRVALMDLLLSELVLGVDVYLSVQRDAREEDVMLLLPHCLPKAFERLVDNANRRRARNAFSLCRPTFHRNGVVDNKVSPKDPDLKCVRDMWHYVGGILSLQKMPANQRRSLDSNMPANQRQSLDSNMPTTRVVDENQKIKGNTTQDDVKKKLYGAMPAGMIQTCPPKQQSTQLKYNLSSVTAGKKVE